MSAREVRTAVRRFTGPAADEIAISCQPGDDFSGPAAYAEAAFRSVAESLAAHGASFADATAETLFVRDIRHELPALLVARARILEELGESARAPQPAFIEQPPVGGTAAFAVALRAVAPRDRSSWSVRDLSAESPCGCAGCRRSGARLLRLGDQLSLHTANLYGRGGDAYEQAFAAFCTAERLLARCGMDFRDVVRTWIHLRDIDRDYDALNAARRDFFARSRIELRPASTGVAGAPFPDEHDCSLVVEAVKSTQAVEVAPLSTSLLNEAWSYGADFSRAVRVVEQNKVTLHVSGTASIDEAGATAHVGDIEAQAERMLDNIASLLERGGAGFESLVSGVTYVRDEADEPAVRAVYRRRGFDSFPCPLVQAALCRPELLCEAEVVAMLPRARSEA